MSAVHCRCHCSLSAVRCRCPVTTREGVVLFSEGPASVNRLQLEAPVSVDGARSTDVSLAQAADDNMQFYDVHMTGLLVSPT
ncbi:unnamed protein product [Leptidea sinapis]|uniref:Uncharacterized protein n=1 Tax=Leptidea sinapis TaxID=189913 RepID=A0A5E4R400_9NEOP|nr:unnamed protein product [Leptidea sinapis]